MQHALVGPGFGLGSRQAASWRITQGVGLAYALQQLINGITLGMIYGLIAVGYTMVYGIIGMINFAHGDVFMIGAFLSLIALSGLASLGITAVPLALASPSFSPPPSQHFMAGPSSGSPIGRCAARFVSPP